MAPLQSVVGEMVNPAVVPNVSEVAAELKELEAAMADPDRADEMDAIIERCRRAAATADTQTLESTA